jgi:hypothetical protein
MTDERIEEILSECASEANRFYYCSEDGTGAESGGRALRDLIEVVRALHHRLPKLPKSNG